MPVFIRTWNEPAIEKKKRKSGVSLVSKYVRGRTYWDLSLTKSLAYARSFHQQQKRCQDLIVCIDDRGNRGKVADVPLADKLRITPMRTTLKTYGKQARRAPYSPISSPTEPNTCISVTILFIFLLQDIF